MKQIDVKVGDIIKILDRPYLWSSSYKHTVDGRKIIEYPYLGKVLDIKNREHYTAINVNGYGFSLEDTNYVIMNHQENNYEIY